MAKHYHPWHLVDPSPWPYVAAFGALGMTVGGVMYFHAFAYGSLLLLWSTLIIIAVMFTWWRDVIREATFQGHHTLVVQRGLKTRNVIIYFIRNNVLFCILLRILS